MTPSANDLIPAVLRELGNYAINLTKMDDSDAAGDLVQDTIERATKRFPQFSTPPGVPSNEAFRRWCFTIMHNLYMDRLRQQRRRPHLSLGSMPAGWEQEMPATQADMLAYRAVAQTLARLNRHDGAMMEMVMENRRYDDIARMLGVAEGTAKSRVHRARAKLRDQLAAGGFDIPTRRQQG